MRAQSDGRSSGRSWRNGRRAGIAGIACTVVASLAGPALASGTASAPAGQYVVRPGDTLSAIARRTGHSVQSLAVANGIDDPDLIVVGRRLVMPGRTARSAPTPSVSPAARRTVHPTSAGRWSPVVSTGGRRHPSALRGSRLRLMGAFELWAGHYGMRSDLLKALCYLESGWQSQAVSSTGAVGIGQLMPDTATFMRQLIGQPLARTNPYDNIHMSAKYLRWLLDQTGWDVHAAVGSYYQGLQAMRLHGPYPDTVAYVNSVLALQTRF